MTLAARKIAPHSNPVRWNIDQDHSEVGFRVRHMMVSWTKGHFRNFSGTVVVDEAEVESSRIDVEIEAASIDTNMDKRDDHLRSADFFDAANHPKLTFKSKSATRKGDDGLTVEGDLTIRGVTRPVKLEVAGIGNPWNDPWGGTRRGATATARINRKDFGLAWNAGVEGGGILVGEEIVISLEIELTKAPVV